MQSGWNIYYNKRWEPLFFFWTSHSSESTVRKDAVQNAAVIRANEVENWKKAKINKKCLSFDSYLLVVNPPISPVAKVLNRKFNPFNMTATSALERSAFSFDLFCHRILGPPHQLTRERKNGKKERNQAKKKESHQTPCHNTRIAWKWIELSNKDFKYRIKTRD